MIRAVLDTNVLVSALFWRGAPHQVVQKGLGGAFVILTSPAILQEVGRVLRDKFDFPDDDTRAFLEVTTLNAHIVTPTVELKVVKPDPTDNKIVECAVAGESDYIVSGDRHLLDIRTYQLIKVVTPQEFLKVLLS